MGYQVLAAPLASQNKPVRQVLLLMSLLFR